MLASFWHAAGNWLACCCCCNVANWWQVGPRRPKMRQDVNILIFHRFQRFLRESKPKMLIFHRFLKVFGENDNKNSGKRRTDRTSDAPNCSHRHFEKNETSVAAGWCVGGAIRSAFSTIPGPRRQIRVILPRPPCGGFWTLSLTTCRTLKLRIAFREKETKTNREQ